MLNRSVTYLLCLFILCFSGYGHAMPAGKQSAHATFSASPSFQHQSKKKIRTDFLVYNETTDEREEDDASESEITSSTAATLFNAGYTYMQDETYAHPGFPATVYSYPYCSVCRYLYHRVFRI